MKSCLFLFSLLLCVNLMPDISFVPNDYLTIQEAINGVTENDTLIIQPGTYYEENLNFMGKNLVLASQFLLTGDSQYIAETIINAEQEGSVFIFESEEDTTSIICGLTFTGANDTAIRCDNSSPILKNLIIDGNSGVNGGGLFLSYSNAVLKDLIIINNTCTNFGPGGGMKLDYSNPILTNIVVAQNTAGAGAGIYAFNCNDLVIEKLTVSENENQPPFVSGGGISITSSTNVTIKNSIIWGNDNEEIYLGSYFFPTTVMICYSDIQGGQDDIFVGELASYEWLDGNIDANPLFLDPLEDNFHLNEDSPCIDTGDPISSLDPDGTIADMGALYFHQGTNSKNDVISADAINLRAYPNPFNPTTTISFNLTASEARHAKIEIYNLKGQKVKQLNIDQLLSGEHSVVWNGKDESGRPVSSSIYFYQLRTSNQTRTKKMILMR